MLKKIEKTIIKYGLICPGDQILVAVSGGPDSVALLDLLYRLKDTWALGLRIAHLDHMFRPEARKEAEFVKRMARDLGIPVIVGRKNVPLYMQEKGLSAQEAARELRYKFLQWAAARTGCQKIAVAHHASDQAETIIMNFLRGTGPAGMAGMPSKRGKIIRPLLEVTGEEINEYCRQMGLSSCTDPSNLKTIYFRNLIRLELVPYLEKFNPRLVEGLSRTASIFREEDRYLTGEMEKRLTGLMRLEKEKLFLNFQGFQSLPLALQRRMLRKCFILAGGGSRELGFDHVDEGLAWLANPQKGKSLKWPRGIILGFDGENIVLGKKDLPVPRIRNFAVPLELPGRTLFPGGEILAQFLERDDLGPADIISEDPCLAHLDEARVKLPLMIRNRRPGDRFCPLGLEGRKKLKDFLMDLKIPREGRSLVP
ncbi:MAG TPA: tRNA lysidine(34) synthetase TilS, partial [Clostridia bacterium]|nr:tRNA lysidine(34) synthetase TilS [Clostridia bacterium]